MKQSFCLLCFVGGITLCTVATISPTTAQVRSDTTLPNNSSVTFEGNSSIINEGTRTGSNLFHSFEEFSVPIGSAAYFNNALDIQNIFSRVTGGSISNIDGVLQSNGSANLFLLNPNGIIFGSNASLNIGGSFIGSTASTINFADGTQFSAIPSRNTPILTISVPIGLGFGSDPGAIRAQGAGHNLINPIFAPISGRDNLTGLRVQPGKTLALIGGNLAIEGGVLAAEQGRIELGSVNSGVVRLAPTVQGWTSGYEQVKNFGDIHLSRQALIDASEGGTITVQGRNVSLNDGSAILVLNQGLQLSGGSINATASDSLEVNGTSPDGRIASTLLTETVGLVPGGDITVSTKRLIVQSGGQILARTFSSENSGSLTVNASESTQLLDFSPAYPNLFSNISAATFGQGNAGNLTLSTSNLIGVNGIQIGSATFGSGRGGNVTINATNITLSGVVPELLTPTSINAATFESGDAGTLEINTSKLVLRDGAGVATSTVDSGRAGQLYINASDSIEVNGKVADSINPSSISSSASVINDPLQQQLRVPSKPSGISGDVEINTGRLSLTNGGLVSVRNDGNEKAGNLRIKANSISVANQGGLTAETANAEGGEIFLETQDLELRNNSAITSIAGGSGNGGDIRIEAKNIQLRNNSDINATAGGSGNGGDITIITDTLVGLEDSDIIANTISGRGGEIQINAQGIFGIEPRRELTLESDITADSGVGVDGTIEINTLDFDASNTLTPLTSNFVSTEEAVAGSCLARRNTQKGSLVVTGSGGLPTTPYSGIAEWNSLTGVQSETRSNLSEARSQQQTSQLPSQDIHEDYTTNWKPGDLIIEAQGITVTADGRTLLDMKPQQAATANPESLVCSAALPEN